MNFCCRAITVLFLLLQTAPVHLNAQNLDELGTFRTIQNLIEQQNIEVAFEEIKKLQEGKERLTPQSQALMGLIYLELAQPAKAFSFFEKVWFSSTDLDHIAAAGMARSELMLGNLAQALELAESAYKSNPDELMTKLALASVLSQLLHHSRSDELFEEAMQASRQSTLAGRMYASALQRRSQLVEAENMLKQTLIKQGEDGPTLVLYSDLLWDMGKFEEALELRVRAEVLFREAGNIIMAEEALAWMNVEAVPTIRKIAKPKSPTVDRIDVAPQKADPAETAVSPESGPSEDVSGQSKSEATPGRRAFSPRSQPEPIIFDDTRPVVTGSGLILNDGYWILTNKHVVEDIEYAVVRNGLGEVRDAEEVFMAENDDLAVIVLSEPFDQAYSFNVDEFEAVDVGADVFVMGYPMSAIFGSFHPTITTGIVSNPFGFGEQAGEFQMTTKINPGNSGGPVFNEFGKIVGVATARLNRAEIFEDEGLIADGISVGVTAARALEFLNQPADDSDRSAQSYRYTASELYKYMRSGVVFIVGQ